jgi:predicted unusual protein kinase regulating ubiquinone biosynthesis (AarF/ABC1/UbiB family)
MELIRGQRFQEFANDASQRERNQAARVIHDFAFESIFRMGVLNCDPHPGNYLFTSRGVAFLDFGCVRSFADDLVWTWRTMLRSALERDRPTFRRAVVELGLASERTYFDFDAHYGSYLFLIRPWLTDETGVLTPEHVAHTYRHLLIANPNRTRLRMPPELLFANRLQWGLYSVLAQLRPTFSFRAAILDILYEPGETRPPSFSDSELRRYLHRYQRRS